MKVFSLCAVLFAATFMADAVVAANNVDPPAGVEAKDWLPISDNLGFVIIAEKDPIIAGSRQVLLADPERVSADLMPPKKGYFVIKTTAGWQRVIVADLLEQRALSH